ncbi:hypothetical protein BGZ94_002797, partial [Podila epigama]
MQQKRNFSGSARSRLSKIDLMSKLMLGPNASAPNLLDAPSSPFPTPTSPRRARLSVGALSKAQGAASKDIKDTKDTTTVDTSGEPIAIAPASPLHQQFSLGHTSSTSYPRHIVMRSTSPHRHRALDDLADSSNQPVISTDALSSSLPSTSFVSTTRSNKEAYNDNANNTSSSTTVNPEKASRHASMPLPKPGWRLYDVVDLEENDMQQHDQSSGSGSTIGSSNGSDERHSFQYSASNASSSTNLAYIPHGHGRQDSTTSTFYTMTPNASNLDLSLASSMSNLNYMDQQTPSQDSHLSTSPPQMYPLGTQGSSHSSSSTGLPPQPALPKAVRLNKSPLALRRSSTHTNSNTTSPSNTYNSANGVGGKGNNSSSKMKSSLQPNSDAQPPPTPTKVLTLERQKLIVEILRTERSYVDGLVILQTLFYEPLNAPYIASGNNSGMNTTTSGGPYYATSTMGSNSTLSTVAAPLLSKKSVNEIFSNFSEILQVNTLLLTQLETRICGTTFSTGWESDDDDEEEEEEDAHLQQEGSEGYEHDGPADDEDSEQQQQRQRAAHAASSKPIQVLVTVGSQRGETEQLLVLDEDWCVGDIFIDIAPFLKMYSNYVKTYTSALTHINDCMNRSDRFADFVKSTSRRPECKNLDFQAYLMLPVQRIPRYRMLLEGLLRHTPKDHPDYPNLQTAFKSMEQTANFVNETIRQHEMFVEMLDLQSKITGLNELLIVPGRRLLKRGDVTKVCRRNVQLRVLILFSDCLIWTSPSINPLEGGDTLIFHRKVGLENCTVIGADDPDPARKHAFQIMSTEKSSQVYVETAREKEAWMEAIRRATDEYLSAKRTLKISITPMQSISAAATSFGAGLLRTGRETAGGLWSPQPFGESRSNLFGGANGAYTDSAYSGSVARVDTDLSNSNMSMSPSGHRAVYGDSYYGYSHNPQQQSRTTTTTSSQPLRVVENYNAPVWIPDHSATRCMICTEEFGPIFRRKHHCRACGKVVCHACSSRTILMKGADSEREGRACDECIDTMFPEEAHMANAHPAMASLEVSPTETQSPHHVQNGRSPNSSGSRPVSDHSLDGVVLVNRAEDSTATNNNTTTTTTTTTGMVRGFVEAGLNR